MLARGVTKTYFKWRRKTPHERMHITNERRRKTHKLKQIFNQDHYIDSA